MLESALKYHELGFSVIPILDGQKRPAVDWEKYQHERADIKQLENWFSVGTFDIGIVTGEISNITVVDLDVYKTGCKWKFEKFDEKYYSDYIVKTPGGGFHFYYGYDPKAKTTVDLNGMLGVDIRNDAAIVVAPPTAGYKRIR